MTPAHQEPLATIYAGDCVEIMAAMPEATVDAIVTDPPYGLGFMNKGWDKPDTDAWGYWAGSGKRPSNAESAAFQAWSEAWARAAFRVLKPGGHLLAFGGSRTYHRLACAIEDAGFEIRDCLMWLYGSGFPKSLDVSKAIDKARRRDYVQAALDLGVSLPGRSVDDWTKEAHAPGDKRWEEFKAALPAGTWAAIERRVIGTATTGESGWFVAGSGDVTAPATNAAREWFGWGTALKPAPEPIILARKPLAEKNVAANVLKHGTGALNVDGCRIGFASEADETESKGKNRHGDFESGPMTNQIYGTFSKDRDNYNPPGRWPANVLLSHDDGCELVGTKTVKTGVAVQRNRDGEVHNEIYGAYRKPAAPDATYADADGKETVENWRCVHDCPVRLLDEQSGESTSPPVGSMGGGSPRHRVFGEYAGVRHGNGHGDSGGASRFFYTSKAGAEDRDGSKHPTVKPVDLMKWLVTLVTPPDGVVLDPFLGSGTTVYAARALGIRSIGIEKEAQSVEDAIRRLRQGVLL